MNQKLNIRVFIHNLYESEKKNVKQVCPSYIDQAYIVLWLVRDQHYSIKDEAVDYFKNIMFSENRNMFEMVCQYYTQFMDKYYIAQI